MTTKLVVIYHSGYGHTAQVARSVADGAAACARVEVVLLNTNEATACLDELARYDAIVFGAPGFMGGLSAPFKAFMDASARLWLRQGWQDKIAAGFTVCRSRSEVGPHSLQQLALFAAGHGMIWVGHGAVASGEAGVAGSALGLLLEGEGLSPDSLLQARQFGARVAITASRFRPLASLSGVTRPLLA